jgi:hypothetical protein
MEECYNDAFCEAQALQERQAMLKTDTQVVTKKELNYSEEPPGRFVPRGLRKYASRISESVCR